MLYLIGIGIDEFNSLGVGSLQLISESEIVYVESFTGYISEDFISKLRIHLNGYKSKNQKYCSIKKIKRWHIEDGREILENSATKQVCVLTYGDPLIATTYNELLTRARKNSIEYKVIHSSSGIFSLIGESGLHPYKFGKMVTVMSDPMSSLTAYNAIYENLTRGLHTLILTEYNNDDISMHDTCSPLFLPPRKVINYLLEREKEVDLINFNEDSFIIVASKIGQKESAIYSGKIKSIMNINIEGGPNSIIIPGTLHFTEVESLLNLTINYDMPTNNSQLISHLGRKMLNKYIPNSKSALSALRDLLKNSLDDYQDFEVVLENAENYLFDSEIFFNQGKLELAILSIGYAEGLIDSIRFQKNLNPW